MVFRVATCAQSACSQAKEDGAYEFAERGRIHGLQLLLGAMVQVVVVEGAATQAAAFRRLKIVD